MGTSCTNRKQLLIYYQLRITISKVRNLTDTGEVIFMPENRHARRHGANRLNNPKHQGQTSQTLRAQRY